MKKIYKIIFGFLLLSVVALYLGMVYLLPAVVNNKATINKLQSLIHKKTGIETSIKGLNLKISPMLIIALKVDSIDAKNNDTSVADIKNLSLKYKLLQKRLALISARNIYIDSSNLNQFKKENKKKKKTDFKVKNIPEIHIANLVFKSDAANIQAQNIDTIDDILQLKVAINTPFFKETLKLGDSGSLQVKGNQFKANDFEITLGNSHLYLDGYFANKDDLNFDLYGTKLPVSEITATILQIQKSRDPARRFIENFKNFKGTFDVNLKLNKDGVWGTCTADNFGAEDVMFSVPGYFKKVVFYFNGDNITSKSEGVLGNEKITHTLDVTKLLTLKPEIIGKVNTTLTKKFNFIPNLTVLNSVNINVVYKIKSLKPDVYVNIDIPAKSDLIYNSFYLGLRDYNRKIFGNTYKDGNDLYLRKYKYSYFNSNKENIVISGDGFFLKINDVFTPQYINCRTNGYAPISVTGSFGEKVNGGEFKGDLKYDFKNNQVLGTFDIIKAKHKDFNIEKAHITSKNGVFNITSNGSFKGEKYSAELNSKNNIFGGTLIYNMKLFLDKLVFETTPETDKKDTDKKDISTDPNDITKNIRDADITINNWEIAINEIRRDKFVLNNVKLLGSMKNNVFDFNMKDLNFADGVIHAKGIYDFKNNTSKMNFEAKNINSDKAAEMTLNLKNQIEGTANAKIDIDAKDMFKFLDAQCAFEIKEGFLPKLGDTEFMIKNSKYKLSEITNTDLSQKDLMKDDIKGTFDVHNTELKNINITTWHELSAVFLEGNYEMEKQYADLQLFWHYSKDAPKGIRIFGIPFSMILKVVFRPEYSKNLYESKLRQIPEIKDGDKNSNYYRIHLKGDINNNKTSLELKEIR